MGNRKPKRLAALLSAPYQIQDPTPARQHAPKHAAFV